jgi:HK97 family phage major capsid protein
MKRDELIAKRAAAVARMRSLTEQDSMTDEEAKEFDGLQEEVKGTDAQLDRLAAVDDAERSAAQPATRASKPGAPAVLKIGRGDNEARAVAHYLRTGDPSALSESRAYNNTDMNIGTAADGGYAVPTGMYNDIIAKRDELALAPKLGVQDIPGQGLTVRVPIDNEADVIFASVSEAGNILQDAPALGYKDFTLAKYGKYITLSYELLRDEDANLLAFVNNWIGRGVALTENSLIVTEVLASGTAGLTLDAQAAIGETEIPEFVGKLMPEYQTGAAWLMAPGTFSHIQTVGGTNIMKFVPTVTIGIGAQPVLWGYPVHQSSFMEAVATGKKSLVFGNFSYLGRRQGTTLQMLRDPYTGAGTGQVKLWFWFDVVYGVLQAEAIQYATQA